MGALREPKLLKLEVRTPQITGLYSKSATTSLSNICYNCIAKRKEHVEREQAKVSSPQISDDKRLFITPTQCARLLRVCRASIYNYLAANSIPCYQFKGKTLISRESLNALFDGSHHYQLRPAKEKQPITDSIQRKKCLRNSGSAIHGCSRRRKKTTFRKLPNEAKYSGVNRTSTDSLPS